MDKMLRAEIIGEVRRAMSVVMEDMDERWVSQKELSKQFYFFSADWISKNGHLLPRERVNIVGENCASTRWAYPVHKINRMVKEGKFREMEWRANIKEERNRANTRDT
jgi:hypothetical protein